MFKLTAFINMYMYIPVQTIIQPFQGATIRVEYNVWRVSEHIGYSTFGYKPSTQIIVNFSHSLGYSLVLNLCIVFYCRKEFLDDSGDVEEVHKVHKMGETLHLHLQVTLMLYPCTS